MPREAEAKTAEVRPWWPVAPVSRPWTDCDLAVPTGPLGTKEGIWGVSAYRLPSHWFVVTYGLSELYTKVSDDPSTSGWGEELTMRVGPP